MIPLKHLKSQVQRVTGELLPNVPNKDIPLNIDVKHFCSIREEEEGVGVITVETIIGPTPAALFRVQMSHVLEIRWDSPVTMEDVRREAYDICSGLGNQISHITSILSYELIGTHIIIPPNLNKEGFIVK